MSLPLRDELSGGDREPAALISVWPAKGEKPVELLARQAGLSVTNASNHLRALRTTGLVDTRRDGQFIYYRLASPAVSAFLRSLQALAHERSANVREIVRHYLHEPESFEPVSARELAERLRTEDVVVLDVRPVHECDSGHIPDALSIPIGELEARVSELPADVEIVAYRRGPYCVYASQAVRILQARGLRARRMEQGMPEWRAAGVRRGGRLGPRTGGLAMILRQYLDTDPVVSAS